MGGVVRACAKPILLQRGSHLSLCAIQSTPLLAPSHSPAPTIQLTLHFIIALDQLPTDDSTHIRPFTRRRTHCHRVFAILFHRRSLFRPPATRPSSHALSDTSRQFGEVFHTVSFRRSSSEAAVQRLTASDLSLHSALCPLDRGSIRPERRHYSASTIARCLLVTQSSISWRISHATQGRRRFCYLNTTLNHTLIGVIA